MLLWCTVQAVHHNTLVHHYSQFVRIFGLDLFLHFIEIPKAISL